MNLQTRLLHRSLGGGTLDSPEPVLNLRSAFIIDCLNAVAFDATAQFRPAQGCAGHVKGVNALAIDSITEQWMVSGGSDGSLLLWNLDSSKNVAQSPKFGRHTYGISSIQFNPFDSDLFTTASFDKSLKIYSILPSSDIANIQTYPLDSLIYSHSISPCASESPLIACATSSPHIRLLDPRTRNNSQTLFGHATANLSIAWSPIHPPILASGSQDGTIRLWDIRYGASCLGSLDARSTPADPNSSPGRAHDAGVNGLCWTPDGSRLISAAIDEKIKIWDMQHGTNANIIFPPAVRNRYQQALNMHVLNTTLLVASDTAVLGFNMTTGQLTKRLKITRDAAAGKINAMAVRERCIELYTGHTVDSRDGEKRGKGILRWVPCWEKPEEEEEREEPKTAEQMALDKIYRQLTRTPIRFG